MKVAILSESSADEAAIRILVDAVLGVQTEPPAPPRVEARRGFPNVEKILPAVLRHTYYRTDAAGLVLVVDSNGTPPHVPEHDQAGRFATDCRLCRLRQAVAHVRQDLRPSIGRGPLHTALGLAVPAVEAWYRCGLDPHATEAAWARDRAAGAHAPQYIRQLKTAVYGGDRPGLAHETERATAEARRLAANLTALEECFPAGLGALATELRGWPRP